MTTIAIGLERCTLITLHERALLTVPQADPLVRPTALVCDRSNGAAGHYLLCTVHNNGVDLP